MLSILQIGVWLMIGIKQGLDYYNNRLSIIIMQSASEPLLQTEPMGNQFIRTPSPSELTNDYLKNAIGERKLSRRREAQEERAVVIDLFKELFSRVNEGYVRAMSMQSSKNTSKISKMGKGKAKPKARDSLPRDGRENKGAKTYGEVLCEPVERKQQIWENYSRLMTYELLPECETLPPAETS